MRAIIKLLSLSVLSVLCYSCNSEENGGKSYKDWRSTGGSKENIRYSDLNQVDTANVEQLRVAWTYHSEGNDTTRTGPMECNPIIVDDILYGVSPRLKLFAIDAATGGEKWTFNPADSTENKTWPRNSVNMNRGVAYWEEGDDKRIIFTAGSVAFAINALTGKLIDSFGRDGGIDLLEGLGRDPSGLFVAPTSPVMIYKDLFFLSGLVSDNTPGHIRAFDVKTGKQKWIFHTIPYPGEPGYETWEDTAAYRSMGSTNSWPGFSLDEKRGILFATTGNPSEDFYGGKRLGQGLYGNCLLALDAETGRLKWHYQVVHHDVWDRDLPAQPALITVMHDGKPVDAVAQTTKHGYVFMFDRETGKSLFPIEERPVPTNTALAGEKLWPTQPVPLLPKPFVRQVITDADLNTLVSDSSYQDIRNRFKSYRKGNMFNAPSEEGTIISPGYDGGGEWGGPAFDPTTGLLYINANEMAWVLTMVKGKEGDNKIKTNLEAGKELYTQNCMGCHGPERRGAGNYPSIIGIEKKYTPSKFDELLLTGRRMMPGFSHLSKPERKAIASFVMNINSDQQKQYKDAVKEKPHQADVVSTDGAADYYSTGYNKFLTKEGYPAISPPWGSLNAINLNTGEFEWQVPFGEFKEFKEKGIPTTGRENYGGPVVTAGGLIFIGATSDGKFRAINKRTGKTLWETDLPASGVATPAVYSINGKQYIAIACGGSKWGGKTSDAYVAFAIPDK